VDEIEEDKLQSFETGYKSGWDDAIAAQDSIKGTVSAEFARNLEEAKLAFVDARVEVLGQLRETFAPLIERLLPDVAKATLVPHVLEQIETLATQAVEGKIEICVAPAQVGMMETLLAEQASELVITPEQTLLEDQVFLRVAGAEREIHLEPFAQNIVSSIEQFFLENSASRGVGQ
jgi:flagellar assembly protein FliH